MVVFIIKLTAAAIPAIIIIFILIVLAANVLFGLLGTHFPFIQH